jgi:predicted kinase
MTGLAGSGKTTLAGPLAQELGVRLISKDAIKEALFESVGVGDLAWSSTLSRAADAALVRIAVDLDSAVLDNFWRPATAPSLLAELRRPIVEVYCRVDPEVAWSRFRSRTRHPGHADSERDADRSRQSMLDERFPLGMLGPVIEVHTESPVDISALAARILAGTSE